GSFAGARRSRSTDSEHARAGRSAHGGRRGRHSTGRLERYGRRAISQPARRDHVDGAGRTAMKILGFFRNRWLHSSLGLLGLAIAIWLLGPQLAFGNSRPLESESARLVTILVIIVVWALNQLRKVLKANKANKAMVEGLVDASAAAPDQS